MTNTSCLNKGDYPKNVQVVLCPNKQHSFEPFMRTKSYQIFSFWPRVSQNIASRVSPVSTDSTCPVSVFPVYSTFLLSPPPPPAPPLPCTPVLLKRHVTMCRSDSYQDQNTQKVKKTRLILTRQYKT